MSRRRYLTKSRFILAQECPTKLFYADQPDIYENKNLDDPFLQALAHGGFQVGALAKLYFPGGVEIAAQEHEAALKQTEELLLREHVIMYEAAFRHQDLFVRVDILIKSGNQVELIEVKAKSFESGTETFFDQRLLKKGMHKIVTKWQPYIYDVAFQTYVCGSAREDLVFKPFLMLVDKTKVATVEGLNQQFLLVSENGRVSVQAAQGINPDALGEKLLCKVDAAEAVALIHEGKDLGEYSRAELKRPSFEEEIGILADHHVKKLKIAPEPGAKCKACEFRVAPDASKKSGFSECWADKVSESEVNNPFVFDIWNFRKADALVGSGKPLMRQVRKEDIGPKKDGAPGISASERQWIQVEFSLNGTEKPFVDGDGLREEITSWKFPLHFIDFETAMVAIPFNAGRRPYEQVAFQFSHHIVGEDGRIEHAGQYINDQRGVFPNFEFLRELKAQLEKDVGTVFRYTAHENTVLCQIFDQLKKSSEPDRKDLMEWIKTVTRSTSSMDDQWKGQRAMVDMWELLKRHYYHPLTNGSNSIKKVLPAILHESRVLQEKYQRPIYGADGGLRSLNFKEWTWLKRDVTGTLIDPYRQLPKIFDDVDMDKLEFTLMGGDELADGGAAMTAYAKMQFSEMSAEERNALKQALLKYCELDTLAMVMLYEHWLEVTGLLAERKAA